MAVTNYASETGSAIHRSGQNLGTGDVRSLYLKLYAGEVLTAFQSKNIMMPLHRVRTISKGKSAQFPMTGKYRDASYHTPGAEILLINAQFIPNIDEAMQHFDIRSVYTQEAGFALSKVADENILRMAIKAALCENSTIAAVSGMIQDYQGQFDDEDFTGNVSIGSQASDQRDPKLIAQAIIDAKRVFDTNFVPGDPFVVMNTDMYYDLFKVTGTDNLNDLAIFNRDIGGGGSVAAGQVPTIMGMPIYVTPHLGYYTTTTGNTWVSNLFHQESTDGNALAGRPADHRDENGTDAHNAPTPLASSAGSGRATIYDVPAGAESTIAGQPTQYASTVAATKVRAIVMTPDAVATAKLMDMSVESEYQINRQGTLMVSKYAMGHNILRPACAVALCSY